MALIESEQALVTTVKPLRDSEEDERRVGYLEGEGNGDQLISASNTGRNVHE